MNLDAMTVECRKKIKEGLGTGRFNKYTSWKTVHDQLKEGLYLIPDAKLDRSVTLFGLHEEYIYYWLWWQEDIIEIREHMPILDIDDALEIAKDVGAKYPCYKGKLTVIDTDFVVTKRDGSICAISAQISRKNANNSSLEKNKRLIEKEYWTRHGAMWKEIYADELDANTIMNIEFIHSFYRRKEVHDDTSAFMHLVARKYISIDLTKRIESPKKLADEYFSKETFKELRRYMFSTKQTNNQSKNGWIYDKEKDVCFYV